MNGAKMIWKVRVWKELENFLFMRPKRTSKAFQFLRWKVISGLKWRRIFSQISQGLNQSLVVTSLADARLAPQL
jgi:hypothetical protein